MVYIWCMGLLFSTWFNSHSGIWQKIGQSPLFPCGDALTTTSSTKMPIRKGAGSGVAALMVDMAGFISQLQGRVCSLVLAGLLISFSIESSNWKARYCIGAMRSSVWTWTALPWASSCEPMKGNLQSPTQVHRACPVQAMYFWQASLTFSYWHVDLLWNVWLQVYSMIRLSSIDFLFILNYFF